MSEDLIKLENERLEWSIKTFPEATTFSSILKLQEEIEEIKLDLLSNKREPEEYADAMMCLFDSAGRQGISIEELIEAFGKKLEKNKSRSWVKNKDNTYSHIKNKQSWVKNGKELKRKLKLLFLKVVIFI